MENPRVLAIGDIVYYVAYGTPDGVALTSTRAAIVTDIVKPPTESSWEGTLVSLAVLNPIGIFFSANVPYGTSAGHWYFK